MGAGRLQGQEFWREIALPISHGPRGSMGSSLWALLHLLFLSGCAYVHRVRPGCTCSFFNVNKSYFPQLPVAGLHAFISFPWHQGHVAQLCIYSNKIFYVFVIWMWTWVLYVYVHVDIGHICILVQVYMWWPNLDTGYLPCSLSTLYFETWFSLNFEIHHLRLPG